jgi:hypothetical protein
MVKDLALNNHGEEEETMAENIDTKSSPALAPSKDFCGISYLLTSWSLTFKGTSTVGSSDALAKGNLFNSS